MTMPDELPGERRNDTPRNPQSNPRLCLCNCHARHNAGHRRHCGQSAVKGLGRALWAAVVILALLMIAGAI